VLKSYEWLAKLSAALADQNAIHHLDTLKIQNNVSQSIVVLSLRKQRVLNQLFVSFHK